MMDSHNFTDSLCAICLNNIKEPTFLNTCYHFYCRNCIDSWISTSHSHLCPLCKQKFAQLIHVYGQSLKEFKVIPVSNLSLSMLHEDRHLFYKRKLLLSPFTTNYHHDVSKSSSLSQIQMFVERDIQAILQQSNVSIIAQLTINLLKKGIEIHQLSNQLRSFYKHSYDNNSRPFLFDDTEIFINELCNFMNSGLSISNYDRRIENKISQLNDSASMKT